MARLWGHGAVRRVLSRALSGDRLAHAYFFYGPAGVGKRTVALRLAQWLLCESPELQETDWAPCGSCADCLLFGGGGHPDLCLVEPQSVRRGGTSTTAQPEVIPIESVRRLQHEVQYRPARAQRKIAVMVGADSLTSDAAHALLKTLEEPPADVHLFLTATNRSALLPTLLSRCAQLPFGLSSRETVERYLREEHHTPEGQARWIATLAGGCLGLATRLAHDPHWQEYGEQAASVWRELREGPPTQALRLAEQWTSRGSSQPTQGSGSDEEASSARSGEGDATDSLLVSMQSICRDALVKRWEEAAPWLEAFPDLDTWLSSTPPRALLRCVHALARARRLLRRNANAQLTLEQLFLSLHRETH